MSTATQAYSVGIDPGPSSRIAAVFRRVPLVMFTGIFTMISLRYLVNPVHYAGISFTSPDGIIVARVGFAAFPLSLAILALLSLFSSRWRLGGLYMLLTVDSVVMAVRILAFQLDHSTATARLLIPETVLLILLVVAIRLESAWLKRNATARA
jgi:hypothetical protein